MAAVPSIFGKPGQASPQEYVNTLRANPTWITSPKADALWLVDNGGRIVRDQAGKPVAVPFDQPAPKPGPAPQIAPWHAAMQ